MPQVGKSNLSLMNAILNTVLDSMLVSMAQNLALQSELSCIFGKSFFSSALKTKGGKRWSQNYFKLENPIGDGDHI